MSREATTVVCMAYKMCALIQATERIKRIIRVRPTFEKCELVLDSFKFAGLKCELGGEG